MRRSLALVAALLLSCQSVVSVAPAQSGNAGSLDEVRIAAGEQLPVLQDSLTSDPNDDDTHKPATAPSSGVLLRRSTNTLVLKAPAPPTGPRRVGIQVGHWRTDEVPSDLAKLRAQGGANWADVAEVDVNLDIARRVAALLAAQGVAVDLLPTTVPAGYVADAFIAIHADSDGVGELSGFKMAHGPLRGPYEDWLVATLRAAYAKATGLAYDGTHVGVNMTYYYAFNWGRFQHTTSPHTPAAIIEMGYLSSDDDRALMTEHADTVASGIANGLLRFLADTPRSLIFHDDITVKLPPATP